MSIGSGLGDSFGVATETTYGTYVAPTHFYEVKTAQIKKVKNTVQGGGLAAGRLVQPGGRRVVTTQAAAGPVNLEVTNGDFGFWLQHLTGSTTSPVQQGATAAYLQTHDIGSNLGKFFTAQLGIENTSGTVLPYSFLGGKILDAEFTCGVDSLLEATFNCDFRDVTEAQTLAAPSYTSKAPFHFGQMSVKLGTHGAEASVDAVKKMSVKVERGQNTGRFYAGASGLKGEPVGNAFVKISGSFDIDYETKADFVDRYVADTSTSLVVDFTGPVIASTYHQQFQIQVPQIFFDGDTPTIDGPDIQTVTVPFTGLYDLTNPAVTFLYQSTDLTI